MKIYKSPLFAVVLLHGLCGPKDELSAIAARIRIAFGSMVLIISPSCRARHRSMYLSIMEQAHKVSMDIASRVKPYQRCFPAFPVMLVGYSHGGVLSTILGKYYKDMLNIRGMMLINAPLKGVSLLKRNSSEVKRFISEAKEGLQLVGYKLSAYSMVMAKGIWPLLLSYLKPSFPMAFPLYGLKDLHPESKCIEEVHDFLQHAAYGIPTLVVATYQDDFSKLFNPIMEEYRQPMVRLSDAFARYITGDHSYKHDTLLALSSQLCSMDPVIYDDRDTSNRTVSFSNLPNKNIKRKIYKNLIHANNLVAIDPLLWATYGKRVIDDEQVLMDLMKFIKDSIESFLYKNKLLYTFT